MLPTPSTAIAWAWSEPWAEPSYRVIQLRSTCAAAIDVNAPSSRPLRARELVRRPDAAMECLPCSAGCSETGQQRCQVAEIHITVAVQVAVFECRPAGDSEMRQQDGQVLQT